MLFKKKDDVLINTSKMNASEIIEVYARLKLISESRTVKVVG
jgi:hypothetical protein